ncbi:MAG: carboxypeptidase-like regulatory domain-containing protein, partial [Bacillota bacterium]
VYENNVELADFDIVDENDLLTGSESNTSSDENDSSNRLFLDFIDKNDIFSEEITVTTSVDNEKDDFNNIDKSNKKKVDLDDNDTGNDRKFKSAASDKDNDVSTANKREVNKTIPEENVTKTNSDSQVIDVNEESPKTNSPADGSDVKNSKPASKIVKYNIIGNIRDESNKGIGFTNVIINDDKSISTNAYGHFSYSVVPGVYTVRFEKEGFQSVSLEVTVKNKHNNIGNIVLEEKCDHEWETEEEEIISFDEHTIVFQTQYTCLKCGDTKIENREISR